MDNVFAQIKTTELKGSTFRSRILDFVDFDISGAEFKIVFKKAGNILPLTNFEPQKVGNALIIPYNILESYSGEIRMEAWMSLNGITDLAMVDTMLISAENALKSDATNQNITVTFGDVVIPVTFTQAIVQFGGGNGTGENGKSAYEIAVLNGFPGTEAEWLASLKGADGEDFTYEDFTPEQLALLKGDKGDSFEYADFTPEQLALLKGTDGKSAYQIALDNGFVGTQAEWLASLQGSGGGSTVNAHKYVHFSFDDVLTLSRDLTTNQASYNSVFDNPFLGFLKQMHETYGAVFSMYMFNQTSGYFINLSLPTKFSAELSTNSSWLKWGFHCLNNGTNYAALTGAQAKTDYDQFITGIQRLSTDVDIIDRMPRIHNFAGNLDVCKAWRDTNCGIVGLLTADDSRDSYYLTTEQSTYINTHEKIIDNTNFLKFAKSETRFENVTMATWLPTLRTKEKANMTNELICFTHEAQLYPTIGGTLTQAMADKITTFCEWVNANGYTWDFPQNFVK